MAKNWMINQKGEYEYGFNWMNEDGHYCGWNQVWAKTMGEARRKAKKMETKAHWFTYNTLEPITRKVIVDGGKERMKGMYINPKSFKRNTCERSMEMDRIGNMITC